jgi:hypothetical protein
MAIQPTILLGILTIISLLVTVVLGILMKKGKPVAKYHGLFAFITIILAVIHAGLVISKYYF